MPNVTVVSSSKPLVVDGLGDHPCLVTQEELQAAAAADDELKQALLRLADNGGSFAPVGAGGGAADFEQLLRQAAAHPDRVFYAAVPVVVEAGGGRRTVGSFCVLGTQGRPGGFGVDAVVQMQRMAPSSGFGRPGTISRAPELFSIRIRYTRFFWAQITF